MTSNAFFRLHPTVGLVSTTRADHAVLYSVFPPRGPLNVLAQFPHLGLAIEIISSLEPERRH